MRLSAKSDDDASTSCDTRCAPKGIPMNDPQALRPRSGDQWLPRRTATPSIRVIDAPGTQRRRSSAPFGFGIRDESIEAAPEPEWEGNPS